MYIRSTAVPGTSTVLIAERSRHGQKSNNLNTFRKQKRKSSVFKIWMLRQWIIYKLITALDTLEGYLTMHQSGSELVYEENH